MHGKSRHLLHRCSQRRYILYMDIAIRMERYLDYHQHHSYCRPCGRRCHSDCQQCLRQLIASNLRRDIGFIACYAWIDHGTCHRMCGQQRYILDSCGERCHILYMVAAIRMEWYFDYYKYYRNYTFDRRHRISHCE